MDFKSGFHLCDLHEHVECAQGVATPRCKWTDADERVRAYNELKFPLCGDTALALLTLQVL